MKTLKKGIALVLELMMVLSLCSVGVFADGENYDYDRDNDGTNDAWNISADDSTSDVYAYLTGEENAYTLHIEGTGAAKDWTNPGTTSWHAVYQTQITAAIVGSGVTYLGNYTSFNLPNCVEVTVNEGLVAIGASSLSRLAITSIALPDSLTTIGKYAFNNDTQLSSVTFGTGLETINGGAFCNCGLTSITLPDRLRTIGSGGSDPIFAGCDLQGTLVIPEGVTIINGPLLGASGWNGTPYNPKLDTVSIPSSVTKLTGSIVANSGIKTITVPSTIAALPTSFAYNCPNLETAFILSTGSVELGNGSFGHCPNLKTIVALGSVNVDAIECRQFLTADFIDFLDAREPDGHMARIFFCHVCLPLSQRRPARMTAAPLGSR